MTQPPNPQWWQPGDPQQSQGWQPQPGQQGSWQQPAYQQPQQPQPGQWQQPASPPHGQPVQPAQPEPQYGGGFTGSSQYGGLGAFTEEKPARPARSKKPLIIGGVVVLLLAGGGVAAWQLGVFAGETLDPGSAQDGITAVMRDTYGEPNVSNVSCPSGEPIKAGHTFECTLDVGKTPRKVSIRVLNDRPEFEVGAPR
ncbi:DUF4333 domain-containing protein [Amycolatopsis suaedae]|uniref:DUF4333 domain-containing protein n=1 Tax=Amycolatopsis suaedae TaxID=2510978 RepID=A0A4Q7JAS4_9PSEU|nr:DUF4333 domain-containing protein [Amycolatopsis suaedae]RZQ64086.1 DUF4333 domain-containing protein [Amycolatopsis suaedae]